MIKTYSLLSLLSIFSLPSAHASADLAPHIGGYVLQKIDFGYVPNFQSRAYDFQLSNRGDSVAERIAMSATNRSFTVEHDCGTGLAPGADCNVRVTFHSPNGPFTRLGALLFRWDGGAGGVELIGAGG